ncbi:hypothetical protein D3C72_1739310 [compost metagenome]
MPVTVILSAGRSAKALTTLPRFCCASGVSVALPGAKGTLLISSPPPNALASRLKGEVSALPIRLTMILKITGPMLNCGSFREPLMGRSRSITPLRSASRATASFTGRLLGAPSTGSPKVSWWRTSRLLAVSWPLGSTL